MKTMTDRVANKVAGTWNKTYSIGPDRVSLRVEHIESRLFTDQVGGMGDALKRKISSTIDSLIKEFPEVIRLYGVPKPQIEGVGSRKMTVYCMGWISLQEPDHRLSGHKHFAELDLVGFIDMIIETLEQRLGFKK